MTNEKQVIRWYQLYDYDEIGYDLGDPYMRLSYVYIITDI